MNQRIMIMREAVVKLTQLLAGMGLRVTQQGLQAFVEYDTRTNKPTRVNVPFIPDDASEELIVAVQGFIDHEIGHILFSDSLLLTKGKSKGKLFASLHNILEDPFVERSMAKKFPGSGLNLRLTGEFFLEKITLPALAAAGSDVNQQFNVLLVPAVRAWSGQEVFQDFMTKGGFWKSPLIAKLRDALGDDLKLFPLVKSTQDTYDLAGMIQKIMTPPPPPPMPKPEPKPEEGKTDKEKGDGSKEHEKPPEEEGDTGESEDSESSDKKDAGKSKPKKDKEPKDETEDEGPVEDEDEAGDEDPAEDGESEADDEDGEPSEPDGDEAEPDEPAEDEGSHEADGSDDADEEGDEDVNGSVGDEADDEEEGEDEGSSGAGGEDGEDDSDDSDGVGDDGSAGDEGPGSEGEGEAGADEKGAGGVGDDEEADGEGKPDGEASRGAESEPEPFEGFIPDFDSLTYEDALQKKITDEAVRESRDADYVIYSKDFDLVEKVNLPIQSDERNEASVQRSIASLDDETRHMVGKMQKDIERMMAARSQVVMIPGFRSGKLHSAGLARLKVGDDRVFRRKHENRSKDTAVELLVDCSGSMSGSKIHTAMLAAFALSQTLERVGIQHECIGFTTLGDAPGYDVRRVLEEQKKIGRSYSRIEPLHIPVFKEFSERMNPEIRRRFARYLNEHHFAKPSLRNNVDGECVEIAARRLQQRNETRKVLIVLSDGYPAAQGVAKEIYSHLHKAIADAEKSRVEVIGIGIQSDSVKTFYKKHVVIGNVSDLPKAVMDQLRQILMG